MRKWMDPSECGVMTIQFIVDPRINKMAATESLFC